MKRSVIIILFTSLVAGCLQTYPLGLNKVQWDALSVAQQAEYRAKQIDLETERRLREQRASEEAKEVERARLQSLYAQARFGEIVTITVQKGEVAFGGKRYEYEPLSFDLVRGETKQISFRRRSRAFETTTIEMQLNANGNIFIFDVPARRRFVVANDGWAKGRTYTVPEIGSHDGFSEAKGVEITISYRPENSPSHREKL